MMKSKKWLISLGLAVVLVLAFALPACTGDGEGAVKKLTVGTLTDVPNLNMDEEELEHSNMGCLYKRMVYETLAAYPKVGADPDDPNVFIPKLAVNYTVTIEQRYHPVNEAMQDAQVWTWQLREGVKWHDGEDFTAEDVEFSLENAISEWDPAKPICWEHYWDTEETVWWLNVTGPYEIEFIYEEPITEAHLPVWTTWDCIVPEHVFGPDGEGVYENWDEDPRNWDGDHIGTGAFKWEEYVHNDHHKWVRNDDWWGYTDPRFDQIDIDELWFQIFPSMESLTAAFQADEIDTYMASFSYANIPSFLEDTDITVEVVPGIAVYYLGFNWYAKSGDYSYYDEETYELGGLNYTVNPLHDKALRQAIAYAIDVQNIIDVALGGDTYLELVEHGELPAYAELADAWIYPEMPGYNDELEMYAQNTTKAAELLTDEGYYQDGTPDKGYLDGGYWVSPYTGEAVTLKLRTSDALTESDTGLAIQEDLEDFGIHINFLTVETTTYLEQLYQPYSNGWNLFVGEEEPSADPIADWIWMLITDPWGWGWDWAPTYWYDGDFNDTFTDLYTAVDPDVPRGELQAVANEELPMYMLYRQHVISAYRTNRWTNWYNELGGPVYWFNPWSIYEVQWVGD
jgi:ABC-type transport system substrate-binding protein